MENVPHANHVFALLDDVNAAIMQKQTPAEEHECAHLSETEIEDIVKNHPKLIPPRSSNHISRLTHLVLYLNTDFKGSKWIRNEQILVLKRYLHNKPLHLKMYYKIVSVLELNSFMIEVIMSTPYSFCSDIVTINLKKIAPMSSHERLAATQDLVIAMVKCIKRSPVSKSEIETDFLHNFNEALLMYNEETVPYDIRRLDEDEQETEESKFNGFRVRSIFTIVTEIITFKSSPDTYRQYPMYKVKTNDSPPTSSTNELFKKCMDLILCKCMNLCNFSVEDWLSWFEVSVDGNSNLQSAIGHLCYELVSFIEDGTAEEPFLKEFLSILRNIAIEKVDVSDVDINDIDGIIKRIEESPKSHLISYVKKMIENENVFTHTDAIKIIDRSMVNIDYNNFRCILDGFMNYYKSKDIGFDSPMADILLKGLKNLDSEDKSRLLKHIIVHHSDVNNNVTTDFYAEVDYIAHNEYNVTIDRDEYKAKLVWLVMQQPKRMLHLLIKQYITGICGMRRKEFSSETSCLHEALILMHLHMESVLILIEYTYWLEYPVKYSNEAERDNIHSWIIAATNDLRIIRPKEFLACVLTPLLVPSTNLKHLSLLVTLTQFFLARCHMLTLPDIEKWDELIISFAKLMDFVRWDMCNFSSDRFKLLQRIIGTMQPLLQFGIYTINSTLMDVIKVEISNMHLITRSHFLRLWTTDSIVVDGMDEQFIMTVHSSRHISYSNLNASSIQKAQEEFIFSIATFLPKFTSGEMKSFISNYLSSADQTNIIQASFFFWDCVMSAFMRIIVYLKTVEQSSEKCGWNYLMNTFVYLIKTIYLTRMSCMYENNSDANFVFDHIIGTITISRQLKDDYQQPFFDHVNSMIEKNHPYLETEKISKLLCLIASINTTTAMVMLKPSVEHLTKTLRKKQLNKPS